MARKKFNLLYTVETSKNIQHEVTKLTICNDKNEQIIASFECDPAHAIIRIMEMIPAGSGEWEVSSIVRYKPEE
jgi:hypothetical protein